MLHRIAFAVIMQVSSELMVIWYLLSVFFCFENQENELITIWKIDTKLNLILNHGQFHVIRWRWLFLQFISIEAVYDINNVHKHKTNVELFALKSYIYNRHWY